MGRINKNSNCKLCFLKVQQELFVFSLEIKIVESTVDYMFAEAIL
jgi:hypothetical protein